MRKWVLLGVFVLTPVLVLAQGGFRGGMGPGMGPGGGRGPGAANRTAPDFTALKDFLGLTDQQITDIQAVLQGQRTADRPIADQIAAKSKLLRDTLQAGNANAAAVGQLVIDIENLRKQLADSRTAAKAKAKAVLSAAQQAKLQQLDDARKPVDGAPKLDPAIRQAIWQATMLGLLEGPGPGGRGAGGPMGFGGGARPMLMHRFAR